jgi:hypothetical protein
MSRLRQSVAVIASVILAFPLVTLASSFVVFPMLFYFATGILASCRGSACRSIVMPSSRRGSSAACACGLSRWGDVGRTLGAKNQPYFDVLLFPWHMLIKYLMP